MDCVLVPPLEIKNYHPDKWSIWLTQFKLYSITSSFSSLSDPEKVAVLLLKLGPAITPIFDTFDVDVENISFDELVKRFTNYFHPVKARNVFLNLKQKSGETFEQFAERLRVLSYPCGFGPFQESFLRDVFVNNMEGRYGKIRAKILESYTDPDFREVVSLADELLLEECSMGSGFGASNKLVSPYSHVNVPSARQNSKVPREAVQGHNRDDYHAQKHSLPRGLCRSNGSGPTFTLPFIKCGDSVDVKVLATRSDLMHVYPTSCEEMRNQFFDLLNKSLNKANNQVKVDQDKRYAVFTNREWCRVIVVSVRDAKANVESLDYGWLKTFHISEFRMLPLDFVGVAPLALKVTFLKNSGMDLTAGECVRLIFKEVNKDLWSVALANADSRNGVNERNKRYGNKNKPDTGRCRTTMAPQNKEEDFGSSQEDHIIKNMNQSKKNQQSCGNRGYSRSDIWSQDGTSTDYTDNSKSSSDYRGNRKINVANNDQIPRSRNQFRSNDQKPSKEDSCDVLTVKSDDLPIEMNQFTKVVVVHQVDERSGYAFPESLLMEFEKMFEDLQTSCSSWGKVLKNPTRGMYCAAPFSGDLYRAKILEVDQSVATLLFVDFGNVEHVGCRHLLTIPRTLTAPSSTFPIRVPESYNLRDVGHMGVIEVKPKSKEGEFWLVEVRNWNNNSPLSSAPVAGSQTSCSPLARQADEMAISTGPNSSRQSVNLPVSDAGGSAASSRSTTVPLTSPLDYLSTRSNLSRQSVNLPVSEGGGSSASSRSTAVPLASPIDNLSTGSNSPRQSVKPTVSGSLASGGSTVPPLAPPVDMTPVRSPKPPIPKDLFSEVRIVYSGAEGIFVIPGDKLAAMAELCSAVEAAAASASPCSTPVVQKVYAAPFDNGIYRAQVLSIDKTRACCRVKFIDFGNECDAPLSDLLELPPDLTKRFFIFPIRLDPGCDVVLEEAMDINISPITLDPDGCWLVQLQGEPLNADYQLPEPDDSKDSFVGFSKK